MDWLDGFNNLLFVGLPYAAAALFVVGLVRRYRSEGSKISSFATQGLEPRGHFWAVVPLHYGVLSVLLIHLACLLAPGLVLWWTSSTWRLYLLEAVAVSLGLIALVGILLGLNRRRLRRLRLVTGWLDWVVIALICGQIVTGVLTSILSPWGTPWLAAAGGGYVRSLIVLQPEVGLVLGAPLITKLHLVNAFVLLGLASYTKLAHAVLIPLSFLWRAPLVYRWKD
jgi:nitrate reductase gamma subunit